MTSRNNKHIHGLGAAPGVAIGTAYIHRSDEVNHLPRTTIQPGEVDSEMERFHLAQQQVGREMHYIRDKISQFLGENYVEIIDAQLAILNDPEIDSQLREYMVTHQINVAFSYRIIVNQFIQLMEDGDSEYFHERIMDIIDVKQRVLRILLNRERYHSFLDAQGPVILVAQYLTPGDIIMLGTDQVAGFVAEHGGLTSHVAILAKAMAIPTVLGVKDLLYEIQSGENMIVDGNHGEVVILPDFENQHHYQLELKRYHEFESRLADHKDDESITLDGHSIELAANIGLPVETRYVNEYGAASVGLYRSEYLYLMKHKLPSEEELFNEYRTVVENISPKTVVLRTIDLGGDKVTHLWDKEVCHEDNPFMGYRAIRICLDKPDIFITQLKAMIRASAYGPVKIMLPMITRIEELQQAKVYIEDAKNLLRKEGISFRDTIPLGILIEVPSTALLADRMAKEVDFFSIGTNDLTQYMLAVDRGNEKVNNLYCHYDPVMIRAIRWITDSALRENIPVSVCGEMAGEPFAVPLLMGLGVTTLSMAPIYIGEVKEIVRKLNYEDARKLATKVVHLRNRAEIIATLQEEFCSLVPDWKQSFVKDYQ